MGLSGPKPTDELLAGRRALDGLSRVSILEDWRWYETAGAWALHLRLSAEVEDGSDIPSETDWCMTADASYPWGNIHFLPATDGGITSTYHHQAINSPGSPDLPWRSGCLCLKAPAADSLRGASDKSAETTEAHLRLEWHCLRALEWLRQASIGQLVRDGEPFELPHFPTPGDIRLAFIEDEKSFDAWSSTEQRVGMCSIGMLADNERIITADDFTSMSGERLISGLWRSGQHKRSGKGVWVRLGGVPLVRDWEVPREWSDFLKAEPIFSQLVSQATAAMRDGKHHVCLVGFPIPKKVGEDASRMHWQALLLPRLTDKPTKGFSRATEQSFWSRDKATVLRGPVGWIRSENWAEDQLSTRGTLPDGLKDRAILLLGCGALGAPVAEMLVRGGVREMMLVDGDSVQTGNLVRHTLMTSDIGSSKAAALANRLNSTNVHAKVTPISAEFPPSEKEARERIDTCDLVLDCTACDDVLRSMETYPWSGRRDFISLSMGYSAQRLFCFTASGCSFPRPEFLKQFQPHWERERAEHPLQELPWEGIGCWHPVFPGRIDDVWLLASMGVKYIAGAMDGTYPEGEIVVFEQSDGDTPLRRAKADNAD
jgi:hypothetical protein